MSQNFMTTNTEFQRRFNRVSFGLASTALGIITLGNTWGSMTGLFGIANVDWLPKLTAAIGIVLIIIVLIKSLSNLQDFYKHMLNGATSAHLPVIFMVLMAIGEFFTGLDMAGNVANWGWGWYLGIIIWWIGVVLQFVYLFWWLYACTRWFKFEQVDAAWVVPPVGIAVACAVTPNIVTAYQEWIAFMWYVAVAFYFVQIVFIMYRYMFVEPMHKTEMPSVGILASPASLMLATYFATFGFDDKNVGGIANPGPVMMYILIAMSLVFIIIGYLSMVRVWRTKFTPGLGSYTFPTAVSALASLLFSNYAGAHLSVEATYAFQDIALVEVIISTFVIAYVLFGNAVMTGYALVYPSSTRYESAGFCGFYTHTMNK